MILLRECKSNQLREQTWPKNSNIISMISFTWMVKLMPESETVNIKTVLPTKYFRKKVSSSVST